MTMGCSHEIARDLRLVHDDQDDCTICGLEREIRTLNMANEQLRARINELTTQLLERGKPIP